MRFLILTISFLIIGAGGSIAATQSAPPQIFFIHLTDIPVMPGLIELADQAVVFDKPEGRIVETVAVAEPGTLTEQAIETFYLTTLPQLGWRQNGARQFIRQGELLAFDVRKEGGAALLKIGIRPQ